MKTTTIAMSLALIFWCQGSSFGQPVCPLQPGNSLCAQLQTSDCVTTITGTQCRPRIVIFDPSVAGLIRAIDCTCFGPNQCGPLDVVDNSVRCLGACPVPPAGNECQVYVNGVASGQSSVIFTNFPPGTQFSCGCNPDQPPPCQPLPTGQGCSQTQCPNPNEICRPRCVRIKLDGSISVQACDCRQTFECHVEQGAAGPICQGECPPGQVCVRTETIDPVDGSTILCCDCQDEPPPVCEPLPSGLACAPVQCPVAGEQCRPKCVLIDPNGNPHVSGCECGSPNECHAVYTAAGGPTCIGGCPPGQHCEQRITTTPAGTQFCCECVDDPQICECPGDVDGNGVLNGADIPGFVRCFLGVPLPTDNCACADIDGNNIYNNVDIQHFIQRVLNKADCNPPELSCCMPNGTCIDLPPGVTKCPNGGTLVNGPCENDRSCCLPDGTCKPMAKVCCEAAGGSVLPATVTCAGTLQACCITTAAGGATCIDADPACCSSIYGGVSQGAGSSCQGDGNNNGVDDACEPNNECGVNPFTGQCRQVQCPNPNQGCLPTCVLVSAGTQQVIAILECDCRFTFECHISIAPPPAVGYTCFGGCPTAGEVCRTTITNNGDGTQTVCCRCEPETPPVCPLPTGLGGALCAPRQTTDCTLNPTTERQCAPKRVKWHGSAGGLEAEFCECLIPGQCGGIEVLPGANGNYILSCFGACTAPAGVPCRLFINGTAVAANSINTANLPAGSVVTCGCQ